MPITAKSAKAKGRKLEQWVVAFAERCGLRARRQPGSGAFMAFPHDGVIHLPDGECVIEAKQRKGIPWATGYRWLGAADMLVVRADRDEAAWLLPSRTMERVFCMLAELEDLRAREAAAREAA